SAMVEWAHRFGCPVLLHEADREWIVRNDDAIELWSGETRALGDSLTLIRCGGHFAGGTVLHSDDGTLLSGDIVQVIPDRAYETDMAVLELVHSRPDWMGALTIALTRPPGVPERRAGEDPWQEGAAPAIAERPRRISDDLAWLRQAYDEPEEHGLQSMEDTA